MTLPAGFSYGPAIDERLFPDNDEWATVIPKHAILSVRLDSGFISRVTLPIKLERADVEKIISGLEEWTGEVLRQKPELPHN
jgi:hypothetical protein